MHSHQYLRDKGCLVLWDDIPENSHIIFVSHEWLSYNHPDPEGVQLETLVSTMRRLKSGQIPNVQTLPFERLIYHENFSTSAREWQSILEHSFLWVDWMSMPQPSAEANKESESYWECVRDGKRAIHSIPAYMERSDFMLVLCPQAHHSDRKEMADDVKTISTCYRTWRRRGWCVLEMFACILSRWKEYPILLVESSNGTPAWLPFRETVKFLIGRCDFSCCQLNHRLHTATQLNQNVDGKRGDVIQCDKPVVLKIFKDLLRTKVDFLFTKGDISRARMYASFGAHHWLQGLPNAEAATSNSRAKFASGAGRQAHVDALKVSLRWDVRNDGERFDAYGISVLQYAIIRNDIRAVREILEQLEATASRSERYDHLNCAMDENVEFGIIEKSPTLTVAVAFSSTNIVASLIEAGADPYAGDVHGNQVTQAMAFMSRVDMVRWWHCRFPEWDWNEASRNRTVGGLPLLSAAFEGMQSYETAMEIIKAGADPTMQTYDGGGMLILPTRYEESVSSDTGTSRGHSGSKEDCSGGKKSKRREGKRGVVYADHNEDEEEDCDDDRYRRRRRRGPNPRRRSPKFDDEGDADVDDDKRSVPRHRQITTNHSDGVDRYDDDNDDAVVPFSQKHREDPSYHHHRNKRRDDNNKDKDSEDERQRRRRLRRERRRIRRESKSDKTQKTKTAVTHLTPQVGWTEGLDSPSTMSDSSISTPGSSPKYRQEEDEAWQHKKRVEMDEADKERRRQWEASVSAKKAQADRRARRLRQEEEERFRRERARAELDMRRTLEREEERCRWEASENERRARERVRWEEEAFAKEEMQSEKRRWEEEETIHRCKMEMEFEETEQKLAIGRWREEENAASRAAAETLSRELEDAARRRVRAEMEEEKRQWEVAENERREKMQRSFKERLSPKSQQREEKMNAARIYYTVGQRVEVRYCGGVDWYTAAIESVGVTEEEVYPSTNSDTGSSSTSSSSGRKSIVTQRRCYCVRYDNDEIEQNVPGAWIRSVRDVSRKNLEVDTTSPPHHTNAQASRYHTPTALPRTETDESQLEQFRAFETPARGEGNADLGGGGREGGHTTPTATIVETRSRENVSTSTSAADCVISSSPPPTTTTTTTTAITSTSHARRITRETKNVFHGGYLWKIPRSSRSVPKMRWFRIERVRSSTAGASDGQYDIVLAWHNREPSDPPKDARPQYTKKSTSRQVSLSSVFELRRGHATDAFVGQIDRRGVGSLPPSRMCFSLVASERTVDLAARDDVSLNVWTKHLGDLISGRCDEAFASSIRSRTNAATTASATAPRQEFNEKQRKRWRKKMTKYVRLGNFDGIVKLLKEGCPPDLPLETAQSADASIDTGLLLSCQSGNESVARLLLEHGASVDPHPDVGASALHCASAGGHAECVRAILESDADYSLDDPLLPSGNTPLHAASQGSVVDIVYQLLHYGASTTQRNARGLTALHCACRWGRTRNVETLLRLSQASKCVRELLDAADDDGNTALHVAGLHGHVDIVRRLLEYGASALSLNRASQTPAQAAKRANATACVSAILPKQREEEIRTFAAAAASGSSSSNSGAGANMASSRSSARQGWTRESSKERTRGHGAREGEGGGRESNLLFEGLTISRTPRRVASSPHRYAGSSTHQDRGGRHDHTPRFYGLDYDRADTTGFDGGGGEEDGDEAWALWEVAYTQDGERYFYNRTTNESQWEDPRSPAVSSAPAAGWEDPPDTARDRKHPLVPHLRLGALKGGSAPSRPRRGW
eukprot:g2240.t1